MLLLFAMVHLLLQGTGGGVYPLAAPAGDWRRSPRPSVYGVILVKELRHPG
ncbi:MAG: hypothetical protein JF614_11115 [Acidobacteria bacterium]|nr:hypothetical protein [Acidobacteriota bacterium]